MHLELLWGVKTGPEQVRWHMRRESRFGINFDARFVALGALLLLVRILSKRPGTL